MDTSPQLPPNDKSPENYRIPEAFIDIKSFDTKPASSEVQQATKYALAAATQGESSTADQFEALPTNKPTETINLPYDPETIVKQAEQLTRHLNAVRQATLSPSEAA